MKKAALIIATLLLSGCASSTLTSYIDPDFRNKHYKSLVIEYLSSDLDRKQYVENEIARLLKEKGIKTFKGIQLFPPTRKFSHEEAAKIIVGTGADGYVTITLTNAYTSSSYVPPTYTTTPNYYGGSTTTSSGGYSVIKPREEFKVEITDIYSGKISYKASGKTKGNIDATDEIMADALVAGLIEKLIEDRLIILIEKNKR